MHELLAVGVEFPDMGQVKIEACHPILGFDRLLAAWKSGAPAVGTFPLPLSNI